MWCVAGRSAPPTTRPPSAAPWCRRSPSHPIPVGAQPPHWQLLENLPGRFPFTAGVFEYKRVGEDPTRMFAGEGTPERTNKRFHDAEPGPARRTPEHGL